MGLDKYVIFTGICTVSRYLSFMRFVSTVFHVDKSLVSAHILCVEFVQIRTPTSVSNCKQFLVVNSVRC